MQILLKITHFLAVAAWSAAIWTVLFNIKVSNVFSTEENKNEEVTVIVVIIKMK